MSLRSRTGAALVVMTCATVAALAFGMAFAQQAPASAAAPAPAAASAAGEWAPRTGDAWVDRVLADINDYGRRYPDAFADELVRYHAAPRDYIQALLGEGGWAPGDAWYACALAQVVGRSCRYVADEWQAQPGQGWGALAQRLGVEPGSAQFQALKDAFAPAYARWARPLPPPAAKPSKTKPVAAKRQ